jgi:signal transduction histidine kinase
MALAFPLTILFLHDSRDPLRQFGSLARKSDLLVAREHHAVEVLEKSYVIVFFGVLAALFVALIARRVALTPPHGRRMLAPLLMAALAVSLRAAYELVTTFGDGSLAGTWIFWLQAAAFVVLPFALLIGLLRAGVVRSSVGELVVELERTPPEGLRDALARGLGDPTLEVAFWLPERGGYGDRSGRPFALPVDGADRAVTWLEHEGEPLAALVHDPSLLEEPELIQAAAAAARLALENARLGAELHAQLDRVKESRARIVAATDAERRRIERDIHDGAQQRLVALALELRSAERGATTDPEMRRMLGSAVDQLQAAVEELRELARGVHPAILTEDGLAAALESLVVRAPLPVSLDGAPDRRFSAEVEATAYFVACEGLANVVKHAGASAATVAARRDGDVLLVEVVDNGVGAAAQNGGSGLSGLADRVETLGGRLRVESPAGGGTRLVAEIPCVS